jgi:hypothetical protein
MEVTGMVQNAIKIMEELAALPEKMLGQNTMIGDRGVWTMTRD